MKTLTPAQADRLKDLTRRNGANRAAWKRHASFSRSGASSASVAQQAKINAEAPFTNEERAELETLLFLSTPAQREFVYPSNDLKKLTGFMGNVLMSVTELGAEFRSNMGDSRRSVRAVGINGSEYVGTIYGTYARMRPAKG